MFFTFSTFVQNHSFFFYSVPIHNRNGHLEPYRDFILARPDDDAFAIQRALKEHFTKWADLRLIKAERRLLAGGVDDQDILQLWTQEHQRFFPFRNLRPDCTLGRTAMSKWMNFTSWYFCPLCGVRTCGRGGCPNNKLTFSEDGLDVLALGPVYQECAAHKGNKLNCVTYDGKIPSLHDAEHNTKTLQEMYARPCDYDWPRYFANQQKFVDWPSFRNRHVPLCLSAEHMQEAMKPWLEACPLYDLTDAEADDIAVVYIDFKYGRERGKSGTCPVYNIKKLEVCRGYWKPKLPLGTFSPTHAVPSHVLALSARASAAVDWLYLHNQRYRFYYDELNKRIRFSPDEPRYIPTARLLLHEYGIECAAFPHLYPIVAYSDTDFPRQRWLHEQIQKGDILAEHWSDELWVPGKYKKSLWRIGSSYLIKAFSRCRLYEPNFRLYFFLHDIKRARKFMAAFSEARKRNLTPDIVTDNMHCSSSYWTHEQEYCNDICRIMRKRCQDKDNEALFEYCQQLGNCIITDPEEQNDLTYPNVFITVSPYEPAFPSHKPTMPNYWKSPKHGQPTLGSLGVHMYRTLMDVMKKLMTEGYWFKQVFEYVAMLIFSGTGSQR